MYNKYKYEGPVMMFGVCIMDNWKGETMATSENKAKNNLAYQFKKQNNHVAGSHITLPEKIEKVS